MFSFKRIFIITTVSFLALVGCNNAEKSSTEPSSTAKPAAQTTTSAAGKTDFKGLQGVVSNTKAAVEAGNITKAKSEFGKFEGYWSKVEDGVKAKSPTAYKTIEDNADEIQSSLKASAPNKQKVLTALQSLDKNITSVAKP